AGDIEALTEILGGAIPRAAGMELIIVPDGPLYSVPWAALSSGDETWIDPGPISIADAPVVREAEDRGRPVRDLRLLALGVDGSPPARAAGLPALRSAEREAQEVSARWPRGNVTLSVGASAGRSAFLGDQLSEYDVIHIASHAQAFQGLVDQTTLFVAGATDAPVTASEIRRLPLNAELVFLSCCEAAGGIRRGVGPAHAGLARSFLEAGARHVIASGIRVDDDAARELAVRFYEHWLDGVEISDALRMAQLDLREGRWAHPYYWAFYQVISAYPPGGGAGGSGPVSQSEK
ncbi:MAG TPA: CHAT domain-containing protein, partial [bacterium]|nr:CHAT domain-containing protein [bacterium]